MLRMLFGVFRDLYIVLLFLYLLELFPGSDLLHDVTRKGVIGATICICVVKVAQSVLGVGGGPSRQGKPQRRKSTEGGSSAGLEWATSEMQGWRPAMEDAACAIPKLEAPLSDQALFAVFDGHGGAQVSRIVCREFPGVLAAAAAELADPSSPVPEALSSSVSASNGNSESIPGGLVGKSLHTAMLTIDNMLRETSVSGEFNLVGSTAIVVLVECGARGRPVERPSRVAVANCGDSRALLCRGGKVVELSEDHKPENPIEEERIRRAGGHVTRVGPCHRVDGWGLNLSRALGDFHYKARADLPPEEQKVSCVPEIRTLDLTDEDEFLVLGCDGIFELHSSQDVVDIVRQQLKTGATLEEAVEQLVDLSCSSSLLKTRGKGGDNCSAIIVRFR
mmetsp:Transcript_47753/g.103946  ORF Transcript_47753/g.103946 Transcript_47753/m.103946 type:complete len:392 (-) Transcript_47753:139-1314(-)